MTAGAGALEASPADPSAVLAAVLRASPPAIVVSGPDGRIQLWSPAAERMFGWAATEVAARPLASVLGTDAAALVDEARVAEHATPRPLVTAGRAGARLNVSASCAAVRDRAGAPTGAVAVLHDLTATRDIDRRFLEAQRLDVVDRIAGTIAHDLRNVFAAIKGFAIVAGESLPDDHPVRGDTDQIVQAVQRGTELTQKLAAFSRNPVAERSVVDLNRLLESLDRTLRRMVGDGLELVIRQAAELGPVKADPTQLEQVVVNLVLNARDAMPAGGTVLIETVEIDIDVHASRAAGVSPGRYARLMVTDTGAGIAPEARARMFEPFFTTKGVDRALGLGLPATLNIVRQMGGQITAHSEPWRRTTFTVDLPITSERLVLRDAEADDDDDDGLGDELDAQAASGRSARARRRAPLGGPETILVVEDDELVRLLTVKVLRRRGYRVLEAAGPADAVERAGAEAGPIHLLLSDVGLPHTSGPELAGKLTSQRPAMKVLFMSGYARSALMERGLEPGPGVLEKPFSPEALLERIRAVLKGDAKA